MRGDVIFLIAVPADEIHQGERVVGVLDGLVVPAQGQPGDAAMVELDELAVGLGALVSRHHPRRRLAARRQSPAGGAMAQVVEIGDKPMRAQPIGAARRPRAGARPARSAPARPSGRRGREPRAPGCSPGSGSYGHPWITSSKSRRITRSRPVEARTPPLSPASARQSEHHNLPALPDLDSHRQTIHRRPALIIALRLPPKPTRRRTEPEEARDVQSRQHQSGLDRAAPILSRRRPLERSNASPRCGSPKWPADRNAGDLANRTGLCHDRISCLDRPFRPS